MEAPVHSRIESPQFRCQRLDVCGVVSIALARRFIDRARRATTFCALGWSGVAGRQIDPIVSHNYLAVNTHAPFLSRPIWFATNYSLRTSIADRGGFVKGKDT